MFLGPLAHEAVRFTTDHAVALAYFRLETRAVEYCNTAAMILNQPGVLQTTIYTMNFQIYTRRKLQR